MAHIILIKLESVLLLLRLLLLLLLVRLLLLRLVLALRVHDRMRHPRRLALNLGSYRLIPHDVHGLRHALVLLVYLEIRVSLYVGSLPSLALPEHEMKQNAGEIKEYLGILGGHITV